MKKIFSLLMLASFGLLLPAQAAQTKPPAKQTKPPAKPSAPAKPTPPTAPGKPVISKPVVGDLNITLLALKITSATCGACKAMQPKLDKLSLNKDFKGVIWVPLDQTNENTKKEIAAAIKKLGVEAIYGKHKATQGTIVLVDQKTKKEVGTIGPKDTEAQMIDKLKKALKKS